MSEQPPTQVPVSTELARRCIDTIRTLSADAVQQANSGHPGTPIALAPAAYALFTRHLRFDPAHPDWPNRDRFVLSCGHASMLLYSMLYLTGYGLTLEDLKSFRQWGSRTPGHPERGHTPGVETTTGPLGQGLATAVGMAIAEELLAKQFNTGEHDIIDHRTWVFCSDGDLMEGISHEAASLAGHLGLGKLNVLYDDNHISIDGVTELTFTDDHSERFRSYGWHVVFVDDGDDLDKLDAAMTQAASVTDKPSIIVCRTHIAQGVPGKQDSPSAHGEALGADVIKQWKEDIGWPAEPFTVPADALEHMRFSLTRGAGVREEWEAKHAAWASAEPALAAELDRRLAARQPAGLEDALPTFTAGEGIATRKSQQKVLAALAAVVPELVGGSADLTPSNGTQLGDEVAFDTDKPGRYLHYGVREHGMAAAMNGMAVHGGLRPYGGTFLIFSDYMRHSIRLAALMGAPTIFCFSHDSIGLGEDGPTHQPVEQLASLRAIPELAVIRPADANEMAQAWRVALERTDAPSVIIATRQNLTTLDQEVYGSARGLERGAYVLADLGPEKPQPDVLLIATGSEVDLALAAADLLVAQGTRVRVVSMPCWSLFEAQDPAYRDAVLPPEVTARVAIEAGSSLGWERWVGQHGGLVTVDRFGASAPGATVMQEYGFTPEHVADVARGVLG